MLFDADHEEEKTQQAAHVIAGTHHFKTQNCRCFYTLTALDSMHEIMIENYSEVSLNGSDKIRFNSAMDDYFGESPGGSPSSSRFWADDDPTLQCRVVQAPPGPARVLEGRELKAEIRLTKSSVIDGRKNYHSIRHSTVGPDVSKPVYAHSRVGTLCLQQHTPLYNRVPGRCWEHHDDIRVYDNLTLQIASLRHATIKRESALKNHLYHQAMNLERAARQKQLSAHAAEKNASVLHTAARREKLNAYAAEREAHCLKHAACHNLQTLSCDGHPSLHTMNAPRIHRDVALQQLMWACGSPDSPQMVPRMHAEEASHDLLLGENESGPATVNASDNGSRVAVVFSPCNCVFWCLDRQLRHFRNTPRQCLVCTREATGVVVRWDESHGPSGNASVGSDPQSHKPQCRNDAKSRHMAATSYPAAVANPPLWRFSLRRPKVEEETKEKVKEDVTEEEVITIGGGFNPMAFDGGLLHAVGHAKKEGSGLKGLKLEVQEDSGSDSQ